MRVQLAHSAEIASCTPESAGPRAFIAKRETFRAGNKMPVQAANGSLDLIARSQCDDSLQQSRDRW